MAAADTGLGVVPVDIAVGTSVQASRPPLHVACSTSPSLPVSFVLLLASFCPLLLSPAANASLTLLPLAIAEVGRVTDPRSLSAGELVGLAKAVMEAEVEGEVDGVQVEEEHQL